MDLEMAEKFIAYKDKMNKLYAEKDTTTKNEKSELSVGEESD
jgi:hypothetical protein